LLSSAGSAFLSNPVTFTATLSSGAGAPTGMVSFYDGTTLLGQETLTSGVSSYITSTLTAGGHSITAVYSGDSNFATQTSAALPENIQDFTVAVAANGTNTANVSSGGQATYPLVVMPLDGNTSPGTITLTVSGLPTGAIATFTPSTVPTNSTAANVTLAVSVPNSSASSAQLLSYPPRGNLFPLALGFVLLPLAGRFRRASRYLNRYIALLLVIAITIFVAGLTACGSVGRSSESGTIKPSPQNYTLTVTGSSGSLSHSTSLTLTVD
jgi:Bacterial Ig-like domain (group 3)